MRACAFNFKKDCTKYIPCTLGPCPSSARTRRRRNRCCSNPHRYMALPCQPSSHRTLYKSASCHRLSRTPDNSFPLRQNQMEPKVQILQLPYSYCLRVSRSFCKAGWDRQPVDVTLSTHVAATLALSSTRCIASRRMRRKTTPSKRSREDRKNPRPTSLAARILNYQRNHPSPPPPQCSTRSSQCQRCHCCSRPTTRGGRR